VYPSLFSTSSLGIVPRPLPQRATTTLTNYPNFLIQATFNIDRTTLETVESSAETYIWTSAKYDWNDSVSEEFSSFTLGSDGRDEKLPVNGWAFREI